MPRPVATAIAALLLLASCITSAGAESGHTIFQSRHLWATVNVCDTKGLPDTIGVRASMPGDGAKGERMFMRFQVQYRSPADRAWHNVLQGGDSGFVGIGSADIKARQSGFQFRFVPRSDGKPLVLRGAVTFEWRKGSKLVRHVRMATAGGHHRSSAGADPPGFSAATCSIT